MTAPLEGGCLELFSWFSGVTEASVLDAAGNLFA